MSKAVLSEDIAAGIVAQEKIQQQIYVHFKTHIIQGQTSVRGSIKSEIPYLFKSSGIFLTPAYRKKLES